MSEGNFSSELLAQVKQGYNILRAICFVQLGIIVFLTCLFIWYIYNTEEYSVEATGIYTAVDHSGNVITQDVDAQTWELFMEWLELNGEGESNG